MDIAKRAQMVLKWSYASVATSSLTFLVTAFYLYKYRSNKAAAIAGSASISALTFLIPEAIIISAMFDPAVEVATVYTFTGAQYVFVFLGVFYAFHCIIRNAGQSTRLVVYVSYVWAVAIMAASIASSVLMSSNTPYYDEEAFYNTINLLLLLGYSIWGFIAVTLLLYFMNNRYFNRKTGPTMLVFIGLNLISAITTTVIAQVATDNIDKITGVRFFLAELTIKISNIVAAYYGLTWIQDNSNSRTESTDLEGN